MRTVSRLRCQRIVFSVWTSLGALLFAIVGLQTLMGKYSDVEAQQVWGVMLPLTAPGWALVGVLVKRHSSLSEAEERMPLWTGGLITATVGLYLLALLAVLFLQPFAGKDPVHYWSSAAITFGIFQTALMYLLRVLFSEA